MIESSFAEARGRYHLYHPKIDDSILALQEAKRISELFQDNNISMVHMIFHYDEGECQLANILSVFNTTDQDLDRYLINRAFTHSFDLIPFFDVEFSFTRKILDVNFLATIKLSLPEEYILRSVNV